MTLRAPTTALAQILRRLLEPVALAGFLGGFGWTFFVVLLPFKVQGLASETSALMWTGWIMVATPICNIISNPLWGKLAELRNPRTLYVSIQCCQAATCVFLALESTPFGMLLTRVAQGLLGSASTYLYLIANTASDAKAEVSRLQSAASIGLFSGPALGALAGAWFGINTAFLISGAFLLLSLVPAAFFSSCRIYSSGIRQD